jgi:hypothetical protein
MCDLQKSLADMAASFETLMDHKVPSAHRFVADLGRTYHRVAVPDFMAERIMGKERECFANAQRVVMGRYAGLQRWGRGFGRWVDRWNGRRHTTPGTGFVERRLRPALPTLCYVEGFATSAAMCGFPILHGWLSLVGGNVAIDPTPCDLTHYFGVAFRPQVIRKQIYKTQEYRAILDNWEDGFPVLQAYGRAVYPKVLVHPSGAGSRRWCVQAKEKLKEIIW